MTSNKKYSKKGTCSGVVRTLILQASIFHFNRENCVILATHMHSLFLMFFPMFDTLTYFSKSCPEKKSFLQLKKIILVF